MRFGSEEFFRVRSLTKKPNDFRTKEAELWATFSKKPFETGIVKADVAGNEVLTVLDIDRCLKLLNIPLPTDQQASGPATNTRFCAA